MSWENIPNVLECPGNCFSKKSGHPVYKKFRSSRPEVFLGKDVLKIRSKFTGEHPCRSVISIKLQSKFIEITLQHECLL